MSAIDVTSTFIQVVSCVPATVSDTSVVFG